MTPSESRRRGLLYARARARYARANPGRGFAVDHSAVYLAPAPLLSQLLTPHARGEEAEP